MTAGNRRWTRRGKSHDLSDRLAAIRNDGPKNAGSIEVNLLGQARFRKMVAVALFLASSDSDRVAAMREKGALDVDVALLE